MNIINYYINNNAFLIITLLEKYKIFISKN